MNRFAVPVLLVTLLVGATAYESIRGASAAAGHNTIPAAAVEAESIKQQQEAAAVASAVAQEQAAIVEEESALRELRGGLVRSLLNKPRKMGNGVIPMPVPVPGPVFPPLSITGQLPSFMPVVPSMAAYKQPTKLVSSRLVYPTTRSVYPAAYTYGQTLAYPSSLAYKTSLAYPQMVKTVQTVAPAAYYPTYRTSRGVKVVPSYYTNPAAVAQIRASQAAMAKPELFGLGAAFAKSVTGGFTRPDVVVVPTQNSTQILAQETTNRNRLVPTLVNSPTDTLTDTQGYTPIESTQLFNVPNVDLSSGSLAAGLGGAGGAGGAGGSAAQGQGQGQQQGQGAIIAGMADEAGIIPEMQVISEEDAMAAMASPEAVMQAGQAPYMAGAYTGAEGTYPMY